MTLSTGPLSLSGPIVTPDGRKILAVGSLSRMEPLRFNRTTGQFERLPGRHPGWFHRLLARRPVGGLGGRQRPHALAGTPRRRRTPATHAAALQVGLVKWAPDGRRLAFVGSRDLDLPDVVYLVSRDGGAPEALSKPDPASVWDPCWLPDGQTLVWGNLDESKRSGQDARYSDPTGLGDPGVGGDDEPEVLPPGHDPRGEGVGIRVVALLSRHESLEGDRPREQQCARELPDLVT